MAFNATFPQAVGFPTIASDTRVVLTRQAYYPMWMDKIFPLTGTSGSGYGLSFATGVIPAIGATDLYSVTPVGNFVDGLWGTRAVNGFTTPALALADNSWLPGVHPYAGWDQTTSGTEWLYVPKDAYLLVSVAKPTTVACNGYVTIERWRSPGDVEEFVPAVTTDLSYNMLAGVAGAACTPILMTDNCWLRVKTVMVNSLADPTAHNFSIFIGAGFASSPPTYTGAAGNAGSWSVASSGLNRRYFVPAAVSPEFVNSVLPWAGTRLNALSALFTNTTKVLNKEGTVLWGRLNPATYDVWNVGSEVVNTLHPAEKAFIDLERGTYSYVPPSTDLGTFLNYTLEGPPNLVMPVYRLDNASLVNLGVFSDPDGATNLAVNLDWHIEFRTSSTLFQIGVSTLTLESLHAAQVTLLKSGFFFHNFSHSAVLSAIVKAASVLYPMLRAAKPLAQLAYATTKKANHIVNPRPTRSNRPLATSGQNSGIVNSQPRRNRRARRVRTSNRAATKPVPKPAARPARGRNGMRGGLDMYLEQRR